MIIDFHTHIFPPYVRDHREELLTRDQTLRTLYSSTTSRMASAEELVATMDGTSIDVSVALGIGWNDLEICRQANDYVIEAVKQFPLRLKGFCAVNPRWGAAAVAEVERCTQAGLVGIGELHPDTQLLDKGGRYNSDSYQGYYLSGSAGIIGGSNKDRRLPGKDVILGVVLEGEAKAYPFQIIADEPLINDSISGKQVLVVFDLTSETGAIFDRNLEGRSMGFDILPETGDGIALMKDRETGSFWPAGQSAAS